MHFPTVGDWADSLNRRAASPWCQCQRALAESVSCAKWRCRLAKAAEIVAGALVLDAERNEAAAKEAGRGSDARDYRRFEARRSIESKPYCTKGQ
jgi:hypothetical protein